MFFFSSSIRHTRWPRDWSSDVCSSDLEVCSIATRTTGIGVEDPHPCSGDILELIEPVLTIGGMRATMDIEYEWVLLPWLIPVWLHQPGLDLEATDRLVGNALRI